jgi:hypothetical protein
MELRRCIISIRQHYIELAIKVLTQLEQFDHETRDMIQERPNRAFDARAEDENLVSLAHRLKPTGARQTSLGDLSDYRVAPEQSETRSSGDTILSFCDRTGGV